MAIELVPRELGRRRPRWWAPGPATGAAILLLALPLLLGADLLVLWRVKNVLQGSSSRLPNGDDPRLLGGLLSPDLGGKASSCLSRYEASKHWKPSSFPVPPYLVRKLRRYEANHRRCGPGTARHREAMARLKSGGRNDDDDSECKYVAWLPVEGLGNRMLSVVSTFLYALLTERVLLVHEPPEMEGLFCEPFPGTSWLLPPDLFPTCNKDGGCSFGKMSYVTMLENNILRHNGEEDDTRLRPPFVYLDLMSVVELKFLNNNSSSCIDPERSTFRLANHTFCDEDHRVLDRFNWIVVRSDSYFAVALFLMPRYRAELDRMFPSKEAVFQHLGRYLLHPGNRAWGLVQRFYDAYLAGADERLGIQVRIMPYLPNTFEVMYDKILQCTWEHGLLPQIVVTEDTKSTAKVNKAVLLVSLRREYYDKLHSLYNNNTNQVVTIHQQSHDEEQRFGDRAHNKRALADIYLLSYCDKVVTTAFSTFGYTAHALAGLRPWQLTTFDWINMRDDDTACVRAASVEPCLHSVPSQLICRRAEQLVNPVTRYPFLRHCQDVSFGLLMSDPAA